MAVFCNNRLCRFDNCERRMNGTEKLLDTDYVGDFSSSCERITNYTAEIINNGTWKKIFKERYGNNENK